ncbi:MAG: hypothetical protein WCF67_10080 [Chitinophagaceae bacterium]
MEQQPLDLFDLHIDPQSQTYLSDTIKWAKFLAIVGFVVIFLIFGLGVYSMYQVSRLSNDFGSSYSSSLTIITMGVYLLLAALAFFPSFFLLRFATRMQAALRDNDQENLIDSFRNLRACYRFLGILAILFVCLWIWGIARTMF